MSPNPVADDFAAIAKRAAEIRQEIQAELSRSPVMCSVCEGSGWMRTATGSQLTIEFIVCENCHNPDRKSKP